MKTKYIRLVALSFVINIIACSPNKFDPETKVLRAAVLPDQQQQTSRSRFEPLIEYLSRQTGIRIELLVAEDYVDLVNKFKNDELDLALFGGFSFLLANENQQAEPLVMRDIDRHFTSYFISQAGVDASNVIDFQKKRFAFGSRYSTSGHLMPRYFLMRRNIIPEEFFSEVIYSGQHDATIKLIDEGKADLGVANGVIVDQMYQSGKIDESRIKILSKTPLYSDYVWVTQSKLPESIKDRLLDAFLSLSFENPEHRKIFDSVGGKAYYPASIVDYIALEAIARQLQLLNSPMP